MRKNGGLGGNGNRENGGGQNSSEAGSFDMEKKSFHMNQFLRPVH
jgi:hypothetical protein